VSAKSGDAGVDGIEDMFPRKADAVHHHSIIDAHSLQCLRIVYFFVLFKKT
jgi:hypothetical protein